MIRPRCCRISVPKDLERVLENPRINQNKIILLETYLRVVCRNILPPAEIFENDKYIFQQAPRRQMDEDESNLSDLL